MFGFLMLRERVERSAASAKAVQDYSYPSHFNWFARLPMSAKGMGIPAVMEINKAFRHCRIGKITVKQGA